MGMGSGPSGAPMAEINVTPLVDVMLVLLIIFMVTAPMMNTAGVEVQLPRSEAPAIEPPSSDQLILSIDTQLRYFLNEDQVTVDGLNTRLAAEAAKPEAKLFVRADGDVPYREVAAVLGVARRAGMEHVSLVFEPGVGEMGKKGD
jgi:biopolymer transport protein TolR